MDYRDSIDRVFSKDAFKQFECFDYNMNSRIPIFFCIDVSGSMGESVGLLQTRIHLLSRVMKNLLVNMNKNPVLSEQATIGIVTYNNKAILKQPALDIDEMDIEKAVSFNTGGQTSFSKGLRRTLQAIDQYRDGVRSSDVDTFIPLLVFMTDGMPVGDTQKDILDVYKEIHSRIENNDLYVFPIGISREANMDYVKALSRDNTAYQMIKEDDYTLVFSKIAALVNKKGKSYEELENITSMASKKETTKDTGIGESFDSDEVLEKLIYRH